MIGLCDNSLDRFERVKYVIGRILNQHYLG
jgi:hypothetical protein